MTRAATGLPVEVCVVPNDCSDSTATLADVFGRSAKLHGVTFRVCEIREHGKHTRSADLKLEYSLRNLPGCN